MSDPYVTLNVNRSSSKDEIKNAYRRLAMKYHPDRNPNDKKAEEKFKEIKGAYDTLTNPSPQQNPFSNSYTHYRQQRVRYTSSIQLSFSEAILGSEKIIKIGSESYKISVPVAIRQGEVIRYPGVANGSVYFTKVVVGVSKIINSPEQFTTACFVV